jgi:hypothetical protein
MSAMYQQLLVRATKEKQPLRLYYICERGNEAFLHSLAKWLEPLVANDAATQQLAGGIITCLELDPASLTEDEALARHATLSCSSSVLDFKSRVIRSSIDTANIVAKKSAGDSKWPLELLWELSVKASRHATTTCCEGTWCGSICKA